MKIKTSYIKYNDVSKPGLRKKKYTYIPQYILILRKIAISSLNFHLKKLKETLRTN
jgi:hypothetical protein